MYLAVDLEKGYAISDDESKKFQIQDIFIDESLFITLENTFNNLRTRLKCDTIKKLVLCCTEKMLLDKDYVIHVASDCLRISMDKITLTEINAPKYDYWISQRYNNINVCDIYVLLKIEINGKITKYEAAFFNMKEENLGSGNPKNIERYMIYFNHIESIEIEEFVNQFKEIKKEYNEFNFVVLCHKNKHVPEGNLKLLKKDIQISKMIKSDEYDGVRGALVRFKKNKFLYIPCEEYVDLNYKPKYIQNRRNLVNKVTDDSDSDNSENKNENGYKNNEFYIGIDLGTTSCSIGILSTSDMDNIDSTIMVPSRIIIDKSDTVEIDKTFNTEAIFDVKRIIGKNFEEITKMGWKWPFEIIENRGRVKLKPINTDKTYSPEEILLKLLNELLYLAEKKYNISIREAIIAVPVYFTEKQKESIYAAATFAGIHVPELIQEPVASFFEYRYNRGIIANETVVLILDLGGGTFDVALLKYEESKYEIESTGGDGSLGGIEFDGKVAELIEGFIPKKYSEQLKNADVKARLIKESEKVKRELSEKKSVQIPLSSLIPSSQDDIHITVTRESFEIAVQPLLTKMKKAIQKTIQKSNEQDINVVLFTGRGCKMPCFEKDILGDIFKKDPKIFKFVENSVVNGAARYAFEFYKEKANQSV